MNYPVVLDITYDYPKKTTHNVLIPGKPIDASMFAISNNENNFITVNNRGGLETLTSDFYRDYSGNLIFWGETIVTKKDFDDALVTLVPNLNATPIVTPAMIDTLQVEFETKLQEKHEEFTRALLMLYAEIRDEHRVPLQDDYKEFCVPIREDYW